MKGMLLLVVLAIIVFFGARFLGARYGSEKRYGDYAGGIAVLLSLAGFLTYRIAFPDSGAAPVATITPTAADPCLPNVRSPNRATVNRDGSLSLVAGHGSSQMYPLPVGTSITIQAQIAKGVISDNVGLSIGIGNTTTGYDLAFGSSDNLGLVKYVRGHGSLIGSWADSPVDDTTYHSYKLTITVLSPNEVRLHGTRDGSDPNVGRIVTDSSITLSNCTWPITVYTSGSTGKLRDFTADITHGNSKSRITLRPAAWTAVSPAKVIK